MRKICMFLFIVMFSVMAHAQGLGDYMEIDGVPGFVFYVDESGEHGLVMSFQALSEKNVKKAEAKAIKTAKKMGLSESDIKGSMAKLAMKPESKKKKDRKDFYPDLIKYLSEDGEQNTIAVNDFCKEKGVSLNEYFPAFYWASQLGDGWFIPGEKELTQFAEFYTGGIGKEHKLTITGFQKRRKEISNDVRVQDEVYYLAFYGLLSSSMRDSKKGFLGLINYHKTGAFSKDAAWFEIDDAAVVGKALAGMAKIKNSAETLIKTTIAVHKF